MGCPSYRSVRNVTLEGDRQRADPVGWRRTRRKGEVGAEVLETKAEEVALQKFYHALRRAARVFRFFVFAIHAASFHLFA
jgi:hypothetical protein